MIAKRVSCKEGKGSIEYLVRYVISALGGRNPATWARDSEGNLIHGGEGGRVGQVRVTNCVTEDPGDAVLEILATQAMNRTSGKEKEYHLLVSFPTGEEPSAEALTEIEATLVGAIGYSDHQRISAVHHDTECMHLHIAINKVHPETLRNFEPYFDKLKLMDACGPLEIRFGLERTNHGVAAGDEPGKTHQGQDAEAMGRVERLTGYVAREVVPTLGEATTWDEVHQVMASHGLELQRRGPGLVIGDPEKGIWVKASSCGRSLSLGSLEKRLGAFVAGLGVDAASRSLEKPEDVGGGYREKPVEDGSERRYWEKRASEMMYARYRADREERIAYRRRETGRLRQEGDAYRKKVIAWGNFQFQMLKVGKKGPATPLVASLIRWQVRKALRDHGNALRVRRDRIVGSAPLMSYADWLMDQARRGDSAALMALRAKEGREGREGIASGTAIGGEMAGGGRTVLLGGVDRSVRKDGSVLYRTFDGGQVRDLGGRVQLKQTTQEESRVALELAVQRWQGQKVWVTGSGEFRREMAVLAGQTGADLIFSDPEMEAVRKAEAAKRAKPVVPALPKDVTSADHPKEAAESGSKEKVSDFTPAMAAWIAERNQTREKVKDLLPHRAWQPSDAGNALYRGIRRMSDGTAIVQLERKGTLLVKPIPSEMADRIEQGRVKWFGRIGMAVHVTKSGGFSAGKSARGRDGGMEL